MANAALIWTIGGVLAATCFARALAVRSHPHATAELTWYTFGALVLAGTALIWVSLESEAVYQQRIVLAVCGMLAGGLALVTIGEFIRPSDPDLVLRRLEGLGHVVHPAHGVLARRGGVSAQSPPQGESAQAPPLVAPAPPLMGTSLASQPPKSETSTEPSSSVIPGKGNEDVPGDRLDLATNETLRRYAYELADEIVDFWSSYNNKATNIRIDYSISSSQIN